MKKVVLTGIGRFAVVDSLKPRIDGQDDVLLKVQSVGICGSDIHYFKEGRIGSQLVKFPFTIGHECSAVVEEIGSNVRKVERGDLVAIDPCISCGNCSQCKSGREHTCLNQRFLGSPGQAEGCLQEYIVVPERNCYPVPGEFSPELSALIEPMSIGYYAVSLVPDINKAGSAAVLGVGPIGLSAVMFLKLAGINRLFASDKLDYRLEAAKEAGASWTGNPNRQDIIGATKRKIPEMFDVVLECCGKQEALDQGIELLKPGGTLLIVGIPETNRVSFDINLLRRKEIVVRNVRRQNRSIQAVIDSVRAAKSAPGFIITHNFSSDRTTEAFDLAADYNDRVIKAMIRM